MSIIKSILIAAMWGIALGGSVLFKLDPNVAFLLGLLAFLGTIIISISSVE